MTMRDRLAARRASERAEERLSILASPRMGYPPTKPNAERTLHPASPGFGAALRAHRLGAGISMTALATRAGYAHNVVQRLETGIQLPTREIVGRLARALGLGEEEAAGLLVAAGLIPDGYTAVKTTT